ncbi:SpoIIE family protein phosphatase [Tundrisphaera lichenicola]|uniref:SpoIIE family protein phosphatase n=1 Tax=Tundrisphaera lichenicola TaxID=2029860 RepID=UPI003EB94DC8
MAVLKKVSPEPAGQLLEIKADPFVIGRLQECQVVLDSNGVSRKHAEIRKAGDRFALVDLHSRNFTFLNGRKLDPNEPPPVLAANDKIKICDVEFVFFPMVPKESAWKPQPYSDEIAVTDGGQESSGAIHTLDASRSSSMASAVKPEVKLKAILEISRNLSSDLKIDTVAPKIIDALMELFPQSERGFLILIDQSTKRLVRKAFKYRPNKRSSLVAPFTDEVPMSISRSIVNHVIGQKKAVLSQDAGADQDLPTSASIADLKIRSVMCVPVLTPDSEVLGIIQLDTSDRRQFGQEDLDVLAAVAGHAAIAVQNAAMHERLLRNASLERDLMIAETVQKRFLPQAVPKIPGYEFFAFYQPTYEVGGDYYDFIPLPSNRLGIALGDVAGKGVAAALMMAKFSGETRFCVSTEPTPQQAIEKLNNVLCDAGIDEKFMTMSLSLLDIEEGRVTFVSAGHPPIFLRRADGRVEELGDDISGFPLGIMPNWQYKQIEVVIEPGDVLVVYSDGVTDARSPAEEIYDSRDIRRLIKRVADSHGGPEAVGKSILQEIREFSLGHKQADDITLVCFGRVMAGND